MITCRVCGGTEGRHCTVHDRYATGGGGINRPCPVPELYAEAMRRRCAIDRLVTREANRAPAAPDRIAQIDAAVDAYHAHLTKHRDILGRVDALRGDYLAMDEENTWKDQ